MRKPASGARNPSPGRLRASSRTALGPFCEVLAGLGQGDEAHVPGNPARSRGDRKVAGSAAMERHGGERPLTRDATPTRREGNSSAVWRSIPLGFPRRNGKTRAERWLRMNRMGCEKADCIALLKSSARLQIGRALP
jgi:hypothetical protein